MDRKYVIIQIVNFVNELLKEQGIDEKIDEYSALVGGDSILDSMGLVSLCIFLEDTSGDNDFEFDWTSDAAMSKSRSMFRSAEALAEEFIKQADDQKK
jgi:acyl carrier protein